MNCSSNPFKLNVECLRGSPHRSEIAPSPRLSWAASSAGTNRITARATAFTTLAPIYSGPAPAQPRFAISCGSLPIIGSRSGVENISWKGNWTSLRRFPGGLHRLWRADPSRRLRQVGAGTWPGGGQKRTPRGYFPQRDEGGRATGAIPMHKHPHPPGFLFFWEFFIRPTAPSGPSTIHSS